jgi:hypothetical protein
MDRHRSRAFLAIALAIGLIDASCGSGSPSPVPTHGPTAQGGETSAPAATIPTHTLAPSADVVKILTDASAGCAISQVSAGPPPVPILTDCASPVGKWTPLPAGSIVTTNAGGCAWLSTVCGRLYVFQGSRLQVATCPPPASGSACLNYGSVAWAESNCSNQVAIATPGGSIRLIGTWVSATYVEDRQLTIFTVFDGIGEVRAVVDQASGKIGDPAQVDSGNFWFTAPGDQPADVAGLRAREAHPFSDLPAIVHELHLETWFDAITEQARLDNVDVSSVPAMPVLDVRMAGGKLDGVDAQQAAVLAFDWATAIKQFFNQPDLAALALAGDNPPIDLLAQIQDFQRASEIVKTAGLEGLPVQVIVEETHELVGLGDKYIPTLKELRLSPQLVVATSHEQATDMFNKTIADGGAAVWFSQH